MTYEQRTADDRQSGNPAPGRSRKGDWMSRVSELQAALVLTGDDRALTGIDHQVLSLIASKANDGDLRDARVYRDWIVARTPSSSATVDRALRRLRDNGWVTRVEKGGTRKINGETVNLPSVYDLADGPRVLSSVPDQSDTDAVPPRGVPITSDRGVPITSEGDPLSPVIDLGDPCVSPSEVNPTSSPTLRVGPAAVT